MQISTITKFIVEGCNTEFSSKEDAVNYMKKDEIKNLFLSYCEELSIDSYEFDSDDVADFVKSNYLDIYSIMEKEY